MTRQLTAIIEREGDAYVALCPELDIASQGASVSEARGNLKEALELFSRRLRLPRLSIDITEGCNRNSYESRICRTHKDDPQMDAEL